ncbi:hypothetical protein GCM10009624_01240 [Gordonia sinesedis]
MHQAAVCFGALALDLGGGGVSTYERQLIDALADGIDPTVELSAVVQRSTARCLPSRVSPRMRADSAGVRRAMQGKLPVSGAGIFHSLDADLPMWGPRATVTTIHDLSVFDVPWAFSKLRAVGERQLVADALRRADEVIAVSDFTAQRIKDLFGRTAHVTPLAPAGWTRIPAPAEVDEVRSRLQLPDRFVLHVGTVEPRKRPEVVAEACQAAGLPFVMAGSGSQGPNAPESAIGLGYVDSDDLPALYRAATVVTYASVYEGFGLPPLEAMACGGVVVASRVGALNDVVGDGGMLVDGSRPEDWAPVLAEIAGDEATRDELRVRGVLNAEKFSWQQTADLTMGVYAALGVTA